MVHSLMCQESGKHRLLFGKAKAAFTRQTKVGKLVLGNLVLLYPSMLIAEEETESAGKN